MKFKQFEQIKASIERLPNVEFFSFAEETVILKNKENQALYQVPFKEETDGSFTYLFGEGQIVKPGEKTEREIFQENVGKLKTTIKSVFSSYDEGIKDLKGLIKGLPSLSEQSFIETYTGQKPIIKITGLAKAAPKAYKAYKESFIEFKEMFNIFDEAGELKPVSLNLTKVQQQVEAFTEEYKIFSDHINKLVKFNEQVVDVIENKKFAKAVLEHIDYKSNIKVTVPKALVVAQKQFNEELPIADVSKKIIKAYKTIFEAEDAFDVTPGMPNNLMAGTTDGLNNDRPQFLQLQSGKYSLEDLAVIEHQLEQALIILPNLTSEDLMKIQEWRSIINYMHMTNAISDKRVTEVIDDFNRTYGGSNEDIYNDPDSDIGFKNINDFNSQSFTDYAMRDKGKDDEIVGDLEVDGTNDLDPEGDDAKIIGGIV